MKRRSFILAVCTLSTALLFGCGDGGDKKSSDSENVSTSIENEEAAKELEKQKEEEQEAIERSKPVDEKTAQETVKSLIDIIYFGEGSYEDYKSLFSLPERVASKEKFEEIRKESDIVSQFGKEYKNSDEIAKNFKVEKTDNMTKVIYKTIEGENENTWQVIEKDGKYYIYNAVAQ